MNTLLSFVMSYFCFSCIIISCIRCRNLPEIKWNSIVTYFPEKLFGKERVEEDGLTTSPQTKSDEIWRGVINMIDVAQISITAHEVSGSTYSEKWN